MAYNDIPYCGVKKVPKGRKLGNMKECADRGAISYYGIKKIDPKLAASTGSNKKDSAQKLKIKLFVLEGKKKGIEKKIKTGDRTASELKVLREELKLINDDFDDIKAKYSQAVKRKAKKKGSALNDGSNNKNVEPLYNMSRGVKHTNVQNRQKNLMEQYAREHSDGGRYNPVDLKVQQSMSKDLDQISKVRDYTPQMQAPRDFERYSPEDLALQKRMRAIMERQVMEFPTTRESHFGGMSTGGMSTGGSVVGGKKRKGKKSKCDDVYLGMGLGAMQHDIDYMGSSTVGGCNGCGGSSTGGMYVGGMGVNPKKVGNPYGGSTVGGKKKKGTNPWIAHVKKYAKEHNISYSEAIKKAGASY
jgi:hypothetical protein